MFSVIPAEGVSAKKLTEEAACYLDDNDFLPLDRFLPSAKGRGGNF